MTSLDSLHAELLAAIDGNSQYTLTARWLLPVLLALRDAEARVNQLERVQVENVVRLDNAWQLIADLRHADRDRSAVIDQLTSLVMAHELAIADGKEQT